MSKGIVMEQHRKFLIVLTTEGKFEKAAVPVSGVDVGTEIVYQPLHSAKNFISVFSYKKKQAAILAAACMLLLVFFPVYFLGDAHKTYAYVNVDINPSMELTVDKKMKIRSVKPLNKDAKKLMRQMKSMHGQQLATGLEQIMDSSEKQHMIANGKQMLVGINQKSSEVEVAEYISNIRKSHANWEIAMIAVPKKVRDKAVKKHISMNKLIAEQALKKSAGTSGDKQKVQISEKEKAIIHRIYQKSESDQQAPKDVKQKQHSSIPKNGTAGRKVSVQEQHKSANHQSQHPDTQSKNQKASFSNDVKMRDLQQNTHTNKQKQQKVKQRKMTVHTAPKEAANRYEGKQQHAKGKANHGRQQHKKANQKQHENRNDVRQNRKHQDSRGSKYSNRESSHHHNYHQNKKKRYKPPHCNKSFNKQHRDGNHHGERNQSHYHSKR